MRLLSHPRKERIESELQSLLEGRLAQNGLSDWRMEHLAAGVAAWCLRESDLSILSDTRLDAWLSHALCAVGRAADANRLASIGDSPVSHAQMTPAFWWLLREQVIRVRWTGDGRLEWRLDLDRLTHAVPGLEIVVCRLIHAALIQITRAWRVQDAEGAGSLFLSGALSVARRMEHPRAPAVRVRQRVKWLRGYITDVLYRLGFRQARVACLDLVA